MDDLDHLACCIVNPTLVGLELLDALKLKVAARIVVIIDALAIGDRGHSAGMDHLHRQAGTGARESADHNDGGLGRHRWQECTGRAILLR